MNHVYYSYLGSTLCRHVNQQQSLFSLSFSKFIVFYSTFCLFLTFVYYDLSIKNDVFSSEGLCDESSGSALQQGACIFIMVIDKVCALLFTLGIYPAVTLRQPLGNHWVIVMKGKFEFDALFGALLMHCLVHY